MTMKNAFATVCWPTTKGYAIKEIICVSSHKWLLLKTRRMRSFRRVFTISYQLPRPLVFPNNYWLSNKHCPNDFSTPPSFPVDYWLLITPRLHSILLSAILHRMEFLVTVLPWIQIILSIILTTTIILQQTGAGVGGAFGGGDDSIRYTRRGMEKVLFYISIIVAILFTLSAFTMLVIQR